MACFFFLSFWISLFGVITYQYEYDWDNTIIEVPLGADINAYLDYPSAVLYENGTLIDDKAIIQYGFDSTTASSITTSIPGDYTLVYKATSNKANCFSKQKVIFRVLDEIPPSFDPLPVFTIAYGSSVPNLLEGVTYSDNSGSSNLKIEVDKSHIDETRIGTYKVIYKLKDSSNNETIEETKITIYDDEAPVIRPFVNTFFIGDKMNFLNGVKAFDNYDGEISSSVTYDASKVKISAEGKYPIKFFIRDSSGNEASCESQVYIKNVPLESLPEPPVEDSLEGLVIEALSTTIEYKKPFDPYQYVCGYENGIDVSERLFMLYSNVNTNKVGDYIVAYELYSKSGNSIKKTIEFKVVSLGKDEITNPDIKQPTFPVIEEDVELPQASAPTTKKEVDYTPYFYVLGIVVIYILYKLVLIVVKKRKKTNP